MLSHPICSGHLVNISPHFMRWGRDFLYFMLYRGEIMRDIWKEAKKSLLVSSRRKAEAAKKGTIDLYPPPSPAPLGESSRKAYTGIFWRYCGIPDRNKANIEIK